MVAKAESDLDGYRTSFGQLINSVVPELPADAVAKELVPHVQTLLDTIDALVTGKGDAFALLSKAADHMPMTADILAGGIAKNKKLAYEFINFWLEKDTMRAWSLGYFSSPSRFDITDWPKTFAESQIVTAQQFANVRLPDVDAIGANRRDWTLRWQDVMG